MARTVLDNHAHDTAHKLKVRAKRTKRPEDRRNAEFGVIEAFAEHLHLDDTVESAIAKRSKNSGLLFLPLLAVNDIGGETAFLIERADLPGMVDRTCHGNELMLRAGQTKLLKSFQAGVD